MEPITSLSDAILQLAVSVLILGGICSLFVWLLRDLLRDTPIHRLADIHVELLRVHVEQMRRQDDVDNAGSLPHTMAPNELPESHYSHEADATTR